MSTWALYAATFAGATLLSLVLTPLALRVARRVGILDRGEGPERSPVPYLGGVAMATAFAVSMVAYSLVAPISPVVTEVRTLVLVALLLSVLGLVDDLRDLPSGVRLLVETVAAVLVWSSGTQVVLFDVWPADLALTVLWIVGISNAFNLLDNMDGLSAGVAALVGVSFFVIAAANGQFLVAALSLAVVGCSLGFLRHNFPPARIYMGDAGSLFLGFLLAALGVRLRFEAPRSITFLVPLLLLAVPLLDTTLVTVTRIRRGISPFTGGKDHVSHRLRRLGLSERAAVGSVYAATLFTGAIALVVSRSDRVSAWILAAVVALVLIGAGIVLSRVPATGPLDRPGRAWVAPGGTG